MKTTPIPLGGRPIRLSPEFLSAFGPTILQAIMRCVWHECLRRSATFVAVLLHPSWSSDVAIGASGYHPESAQLSCHDAPIFRLLLKIAVSLTAFNVTFTIFWWLMAATHLQSIQNRLCFMTHCTSCSTRHIALLFVHPSLFLVCVRRGRSTLP